MTALARPGDTVAPDRATVHVIDDDASPREALSLLFPTVGLAVRTYASVQEFLDAGEHDGLGCILLDVRLPGISGLDFQLRRDGLGVHLPIVLMTGHGDVPMSVRAMKAGAVDFLPKPFRDQDMIDAVTAAIERDRQRRADGDRASASVARLSPRKQVLARWRPAREQADRLRPRPERDHGQDISRHGHAKMAAGLADLVRMADALALRFGVADPNVFHRGRSLAVPPRPRRRSKSRFTHPGPA